jgi:hypothetical protein
MFEELLLPSRKKDENPDQAMINDTLDRYLLGQAKLSTGDFIARTLLNKSGFTSNNLDEQKTKLEIEMMKRQLGQYEDDDKYEDQMNDGVHPLLVARNVQRYAQRGKTLVEKLLGDIPHGSLVTRLTSR